MLCVLSSSAVLFSLSQFLLSSKWLWISLDVPRCAIGIHPLCMLPTYGKIMRGPAILRQLFQSGFRQVSPQIPPDSGATPEMAGIASWKMLKWCLNSLEPHWDTWHFSCEKMTEIVYKPSRKQLKDHGDRVGDCPTREGMEKLLHSLGIFKLSQVMPWLFLQLLRACPSSSGEAIPEEPTSQCNGHALKRTKCWDWVKMP